MLALSGGVDSSVCAALLSKAIPGQLACIFVDHGFMRLNEGDEIECIFRHEAKLYPGKRAHRFLSRIKGVADPEQSEK